MLEDFMEYVNSVRRYGGDVEKIVLCAETFHAFSNVVRQNLDLGLYVGYNVNTGEFYFRVYDVLVCSPPNQVGGM